MLIKHISLANFRNYETAEVSFAPGVNLLVGPIGPGKTNLVEAIRYLSTLSSHRVAGYLPLIRHAKPEIEQAVIRVLANHDSRDALLEVELNRSSPNRARINKANATRLRDILGYVNTVTFAPEDLDIIKKDPSNRRAFIDELLVQVSPRFSGVFTDYERVLKQRNTLLRTARQTSAKGTALSTLDAWDESLVKFGAEIVAARVALVERLRPLLTVAYQSIAIANNEPRILTKSSLVGATVVDEDDTDVLENIESSNVAEVEELFRAKLAQIRQNELDRGITMVGPHRDDLVLMLSDLPAKGYASHGESWSFALALRLASISLLRAETRSGDPILILDDVFAELDAGRRSRLAELVAGNEQVLITAAVGEDVPAELKARVFKVAAGEVSDGA